MIKNILSVKPLGLLFSLVSFSATAQIYFSEATDISIARNGIEIQDPLTGGFNNAQFSEIDLDLDGTLDLVVFDRFRGLVRPYINSGIKDSIDYTYAPEYAEKFPEMNEILITRDYNNDGKMDLYVSGIDIKLYENTSTSSKGLSFQLVSKLQSKNNPARPDLGSINPGSVNFPALIDIENDGDIDMIYRSGRTLDYQRNYSIDRNNNFTPLYERRSPCWGYVSFLFGEGSSSIDSIALNDCRGLNRGERWNRDKHSEAKSATAIDIDLNSSIDLLTSDIRSYQMRLLLNADSNGLAVKENSEIYKIIDSFPNYDTPVHLLYATAYFIDLNNDGKKDMIASSSHSNTEPPRPYAKEDIWIYENTATNKGYKFSLISKSFIKENTIDVGRKSKPIFIDYNKDGLKDIIIGNGGYLPDDNTERYIESLSLLENIGTDKKPAFNLVDNDFLQLSTLNLSPGLDTFPLAAPAAADIDGDGDEDLFIVQYDGRVYWFEDTSGTGISAEFKFHPSPFQRLKNLDAVSFFDVDKNGTLDLIGNTSSEITYFTNFGSPSTPLYTIELDSIIWIGGDTMRYFIKTPPDYSFFKVGDSLAVDQATHLDNNRGIALILERIDTINHFFDCVNLINPGIVSNRLDELNTPAVINYFSKTWQMFRFNQLSGLDVRAEVENVFLFEDQGQNILFAGGNINTTYMIYPFIDSLKPIYGYKDPPRILMPNLGYNMFLNGADLNGDSIMDLAVGLATGGLKILYGSRVNSIKESSNNARKSSNSLQLYPNPSKGFLNIELKVEATLRINQLEIRDVSGKLILTDQFIGLFKTIDLGQLPNGVYFITVRNELGIYSEKFIFRP